MNRLFRWLLWLVLFSSTANAATLTIPADFVSADLTPVMEYLPDPANRLTAVTAQSQAGWQPLKRGDLGYRNYPIWARVTLLNPSNQPRTLVLTNPRTGINRIDVTLLEAGRPVSETTLGLIAPIAEQPLGGRFPSLPVTLPGHGSVTVVSRTTSVGPIGVSWIAKTPNDYTEWITGDTWIRGVFGGVTLAIAIYGLWLWYGLRRPVLLAYAAFGFLLFMASSSYQGLYRVYDLGLPLMVGYYSTWFSGGLLAIAILAIAIYLFDTRNTMPRVHVWLRRAVVAQTTIVVLLPVSILLGLLGRLAPLYHVGLVATCAGLLLAGLNAWRKRLPGARYYMMGQGSLMVGFVLLNLSQMGWLVEAWHYSLVLPAATLAEVIFLAKAIGERLALMRQEFEAQREHALVQSRFASLGKTMGLVVHQWRKPLARQGALLTELAIQLQQPATVEWPRQLEGHWLPRMQQHLDLMDRTIRDFQAYFSAERPTQRFAPAEVIDQTCALMTWQQSLPEIVIHWTPPGARIEIVGDPTSLAHILIILLDNAIDAFKARSVSHPAIRIELAKTAGQVTIEVNDNAGGIAMRPIERIFDGFVSAGRENGSGMGLYFARMMVQDQLNGHIAARNTPEGACFTITTPAAEPPS